MLIRGTGWHLLEAWWMFSREISVDTESFELQLLFCWTRKITMSRFCVQKRENQVTKKNVLCNWLLWHLFTAITILFSECFRCRFPDGTYMLRLATMSRPSLFMHKRRRKRQSSKTPLILDPCSKASCLGKTGVFPLPSPIGYLPNLLLTRFEWNISPWFGSAMHCLCRWLLGVFLLLPYLEGELCPLINRLYIISKGVVNAAACTQISSCTELYFGNGQLQPCFTLYPQCGWMEMRLKGWGGSPFNVAWYTHTHTPVLVPGVFTPKRTADTHSQSHKCSVLVSPDQAMFRVRCTLHCLWRIR